MPRASDVSNTSRLSRIVCLIVLALGAKTGLAEAPAKAPPGDDATPLYLKASELAKVNSPSLTEMEWDTFQPLPPEWRRVAEEAWKANGPAYALAREARSL